MKTLLYTLSIILVVVIIASSCKKQNEQVPSFKAYINGIEFVPKSVGCSLSNNSQHLIIHTSDETTKTLSIFLETDTISDCMPTGNYPTQDIMIVLSYYTENGSVITEHIHTDINSNSTLSASITSCSNGEISGTFSGTFKKVATLQDEFITPDIVEITNGEFNNIPFIVLSK